MFCKFTNQVLLQVNIIHSQNSYTHVSPHVVIWKHQNFTMKNQSNISKILYYTIIITKILVALFSNIAMQNIRCLNLNYCGASVPLCRVINSEENIFASIYFVVCYTTLLDLDWKILTNLCVNVNVSFFLHKNNPQSLLTLRVVPVVVSSNGELVL